jgi:hypothetical protein
LITKAESDYKNLSVALNFRELTEQKEKLLVAAVVALTVSERVN